MDEMNIFEGMVESSDEKNDDEFPPFDLPFHDVSDLADLGDLGDLALLRAAIDGNEAMDDDKIEEGEILLQDSLESTPEAPPQIDSDIDLLEDDVPQLAPMLQFEVAIPELSVEKQSEYSTVYSSVVEQVTGVSDFTQDPIQYNVEFTDGRVDSVRVTQPRTFTRALLLLSCISPEKLSS